MFLVLPDIVGFREKEAKSNSAKFSGATSISSKQAFGLEDETEADAQSSGNSVGGGYTESIKNAMFSVGGVVAPFPLIFIWFHFLKE